MADEKPYNISIETKAQLAELQKLLTELRAINAEIAKMNGLTFSSINASVSELAKAGKELSSALVSLPKTMDTIADDVKKIGEESKKAGEDLNGLKTTAQGVFMELGAQITDFAVNKLKQIPAAIMSSIEAFGQQEMAVQKLAAAIRSQGGNVSEILPIYESLAGEMQRLTTYGDEEVLALQSTATAMGVTSEQMDLCIKGAIGLSNVFGIGLNEAVRAAATVVQGKTDKLNEMIPALSKCKSETEKYAIAEKAMKDGFAQAKAEAESTTGRLKQAANAWGDLAEVAGETFAPVAVEVAGALKSVCEWFAFSKIGGLANVASLFKLVASGMTGAKMASDALNVSLKANPLGIAMTAVTGFTLLISKLKEAEQNRYESNIKKSKEYRDALDEEISTLKEWGASEEYNTKRSAEIQEEIENLKQERTKYKDSHGETHFRQYGSPYKSYSKEEQAEIDNYNAKIEKLEETLKAYSDKKGLAEIYSKQHAAALEAEKKILAESEKEMRAAKSEADALIVIKEKLAETEKEVSRLTAEQKSGAWADKDREANANRLRQAKLELVELGKKELEQILKIDALEYESKKAAELNKQRDLERQIAEAILKGNSEKAKSLKLELEKSKAQENEYSTISSYIAERKAEIKTEEDLKRVKEEAERYADATLKLERQKSESDRFLAEKAEKTKETQRSLETDILRLRAAGNEAGAKELEQQLRISQIESEIFENTRKEGMGREKLMKLSEDAKKNAAERYKLEKEITDEAERQNLAKDNQAKIEDILLTNKIEQLKAEGKLAEAQSLEDERSIKRTLSGMKGLSEEQKKSLAETMRQTNAYREQQQNKSAAGDARTPGTGSTAASSLRTSSPPKTGGKEDGRPVTVSEKSAGYYDEWKAAGGSRSGISWTDFRKQKQAQESKQSNGKKQPSSSAYSSQSVSILDNIEERSWAMANGVVFKDNNPPKTATPNVGGAVNDASKSASNDFRTRQTLKPAETSLKKKAALPTLNNKLDSMGVKSEETTENNSAQSLGDIAASVRTLCEDIKSLKTTVTALAEKRNK